MMASYPHISRRAWLNAAGGGFAAATFARHAGVFAGSVEPVNIADSAFEFVKRCARDDGGYDPSPDPKYAGESDTSLSDLAAVTYAATLAKTLGWQLPHRDRSIEFIQGHQKSDGSFATRGAGRDPAAPLSVLYNTVQATVALRALGAKPKLDPTHSLDRFFVADEYKKLPWYTTSFFPLFYAALGKPFPTTYDRSLRDWQTSHQAEDGYLGDHVAATFHLVHYFRLVGRPAPKAAKIVERVLHDQKSDGGWNIKAPDWDVHACFDAVFILRQIGGDSEPVRRAIERAADWAMTCRNDDGGFGHFPKMHSDMDAVYFQLGTLIQAGQIPSAKLDLPDGNTLSWGHAMQPGKIY